jgi:2-polyprenyl-3-methyl-5-hydroxy-6-metoxy-1,4-benzoquinol methylase
VERLPKGGKVLDAGCGSDILVTKYLSQFFEVTGVDFAEAQIELARRSVPDADFLCQDMTELDSPDFSA